MAEKLSIIIALEGAAEIERQLGDIGKAGTKAFEEIAAAAEKSGGFQQLDPKEITAKLQEFGIKGKEAIDKITTAVAQAGRLESIVGGVRQVEAGFASIGVAASAMSQRVTGAFTAIATAAASTGGAVGRLARSFGLIGGGAIAGSLGAVVVGMEKAADSARILEGNLQALFKNEQAGTAFFNQIQNAAQASGASLKSTADTMVGIVNAIQKALQAKGFRFAPGEGLKQATQDATILFDTLQKGMQLSGARAEEANKAITTLFAGISKSGELSGDALRKFAAQFPQLANELAKALGAPGGSIEQLADRIDKGLTKIDFRKFMNAVKQVAPEIDKLRAAFDPTLGQRIDIIAGAWDRLLNSFGKSPASAAIKAAMDDIARGLDEIAKKQEQIGKFTVDKPPSTVTGGLMQQMFDEFNQNIAIAKQNWEQFKNIVSQPVTLALTVANLTPVGLAINALLNQIEKLRRATKDKITIPFEADPEPPWVETYLQLIENVKFKFRNMLKPETEEGPPQQPAWVEAYLGWIEQVKDKFRNMLKPETEEGPPQQPAWVEAYLGWIDKVKAAARELIALLNSAMTKRPEPGGQLGGQGVPLMGLPPALQDIGAARIEDRRDPGLEAMRASAQAVFDQIQQMGTQAFAAIAAAGEQAATSIAAAFGQLGQTITSGLDFSGLRTAVEAITSALSTLDVSGAQSAFQTLESSAVAGMQNITSAIQQATAAMQELAAAANAAASAASAASSAGSGAGGFARGGQVFGRPGRDKVPAYLTRDEWVMRVAAVRKYGHAFMRAVNEGRFNIPKFNLGGLVDGLSLPMPMNFANGGLVPAPASGRSINLTIVNGAQRDSFRMWADADVAEKVVRYTISRQAASAGRKSGAFG